MRWRPWQALAAAGAAWTGLLVLFRIGVDEPHAPTTPPAAPGAMRWTLLGNPAQLRTGRRYRGCISVPWPFSPSVETVRARAMREGFSDVDVATSRPDAWPPDADCKHYVEATWSGPDKSLDVPGVIKWALERTEP